MKVLHIINTLSVGGAELHLLTLCKYLKAQGVDVVVACLREKIKGSAPLRKDFEGLEIPVYDLRAEGRYDPRFPYRMARLVKSLRPDVLHTHLPRADMGGAVCSWLDPSAVWVSSVHSHYSQTWSASWALPILNLSWRRATGVVAISHALREWLLKETSVPAAKIEVVHYGIEPDKFAKVEPRPLRAPGSNEPLVIGSVGRIEPGKKHDLLIRSMPRILREIPCATLLIAGHDPMGYGKHLEDLISALDLTRSVELVGFKNDIPAFLNQLDVFALASTSEGFGQVVIEAMASARPVVAMRIPPMTELVNDGDNGLLVDPDVAGALGGAILRLLRDRALRDAMGSSGRQRVLQQFSARLMAERMLSFYRRLET